MLPVVEYRNGSIHLIPQIRLYQFSQSYALAAHVAALRHTGIEETQQTTLAVFHLSDIIAAVAHSRGVYQFGLGLHIVAAENAMYYLTAE